MTEPVSIAVVGAGNRGQIYADLAAADGRAQVVAVADPDCARREELADRHAVAAERRFDGWEALVGGPRMADMVVVATQDRFHYGPAVALLDRGYHLLLEKPIATTPQQCDDIVEAAERAGATFAVCHVMRYAPYSLTLQHLLNSGAIGELVSVEHLEPIGWWHFAHSFVRGNWRREDESSFMLLAKCVHDIDWLSHVIGRPARRVSSFGGLYHFRADQRPEEAADRCVDCVLQRSCPYSAPTDLLALPWRSSQGTLAAAGRHIRPHRRRCPRGLAGWPVRPLRLCQRQRRRRSPGRVHRIRGWRHGELHRYGFHRLSVSQDKVIRHPRVHRGRRQGTRPARLPHW